MLFLEAGNFWARRLQAVFGNLVTAEEFSGRQVTELDDVAEVVAKLQVEAKLHDQAVAAV